MRILRRCEFLSTKHYCYNYFNIQIEPIALSIGLILGITVTAGISVATYIMWKKHRKQR